MKIRRKARCAHPGCDAKPKVATDGHLFFLGDVPAAWVCDEHAERAGKLVEVTSDVILEGARLAGKRVVTGAANRLADFLFGSGK